MQYGHALDCLLIEIVVAEPKLGPVYKLMADLSDGFYQIGLRTDGAPKMGLISPGTHGGEHMLALLLTLTMGWKKPPPLFCTATENISYIANA